MKMPMVPKTVAFGLLVSAIPLHALHAQRAQPPRPLHTYSIVAVDSATGQIGVAVQSHWFSVGSVVSWAEPGVGAVATQSFIDPAYGPRGLALMRTGVTGPLTLRALVAADPDSAMRQLAMIDAKGRVANFTGARNIPEAGGHVGKGYAVQANLMAKNTVWPAMARAYETTKGDLAERMLAALEAAQREGGDIRGQQSAALIVVSGDRSLPPWDRIFDLRVEDSPAPLVELRRLVRAARAYQLATAGDNFVTRNQIDSAVSAYGAASRILPDSVVNGELSYWLAVTLADKGRVDESLPHFRRAFEQDASWATLLWRLPKVGLLGADSATIARIVRDAMPAPGVRRDPNMLQLSKAEVELDAFSGRPNPRWELNQSDARALNATLRSLETSQPRALPQSLGYRGFVVTDATTRTRYYVTRGYIMKLEDNQVVATWRDARGTLQELERQARARGFAGVLRGS